MNSQPLVSIITPYFNSDTYISETIDSVIKQTYQNWEHIIVDDGSTDESFSFLQKIAQQDDRIKVFKRNRLPKGRSTSRNIGIEKSTGKYLIFLDSDDLLYSHCLEKRVLIMEKNDFDFAVFQMEMFLPNADVKEVLSTLDVPNYLQAFLSGKHPWNITCPIWVNTFFKANAHGFLETLSILEDPEMHTRVVLLDNISYAIYSGKDYIDSSYRVDYKPTVLKPQLNAVTYYIKYFSKQLQGRKDEKESLQSLRSYYETMLSHYSGQSKEEIYNNIEEIKRLNIETFHLSVIDKKMYTKTKYFLRMLGLRLFESKAFVFTLNRLGFYNFYNFVFDRFCNNIQ